MTANLLAISIGPVQDFIAAARRTRDLWFGSHMLSEVSKAAARAVQKSAGTDALIFPAPENESALEPTPDGENPTLVVANVILAQLPEGKDPREVATQAECAAKERWIDFAEDARGRVSDLVLDDIWKDHVGDVIDFYAAWVPFPTDGDYARARSRVMRLLSARKACRDFRQPRLDGEYRRLPKSSLDGARETILKKGTRGSNHLRLADGEQLDAIGLTKRLAGGSQSYPSVARIAADPWLTRLAASLEHKEIYQRLLAECRRLTPKVLSRVQEPAFSNFPYEGTAVYMSRHPSIAAEAGVAIDQLSELIRIVDALTRPPGKGGLGEPDPYLAILMADGDGIGALLSRLGNSEEHRAFSRRLSEFAHEARSIIKDSHGVCVYAGGDDVFAFVPLDGCLECARKLRAQFEKVLGQVHGCAPTLSVGIAVAHFMEPLEDLRAYAKNAEQAAKRATPKAPAEPRFGDRNGIAVHVHPRGGVFFAVRERWQEGDSSLDQRLDRWSKLFHERCLPNKLPYDLRELASTYISWSRIDSLTGALQADCVRLLRRKQVRVEKNDQDWLAEQLRTATDADGLLRLSAELLVAQKLAEANSEFVRHEQVAR